MEAVADSLRDKYSQILNNIGLKDSNTFEDVYRNIRLILSEFMSAHNRVGIYCYGYHTKLLMTDFVSELRDVVCVIDNSVESSDSGLRIIRDGDIDDNNLDGIIVSSFRYKDDIISGLREKHSAVDTLDIYEELEKLGIKLKAEFYCIGPYYVYLEINDLKRKLLKCKDTDRIALLEEILHQYIIIKDFRMAGEILSDIMELSGDRKYSDLLDRVNSLYDLQLETIAKADDNSVVMMCLDGMRRADCYGSLFSKTYAAVSEKAVVYTRAYSYSTMTFESLVPAFSENSDQQTGYYNHDAVESTDCRFMKKALDQNRDVVIYGDGYDYISDEKIRHAGDAQTITEKLWDFVLDISRSDNGLFYIHELYESHFSYPNPYTNEKLVANGTSVMYDLLPRNGGRLKADYEKQREDSLRYLDDTLAPILKRLHCPFVLFADHGNLIPRQGTIVSDITDIQFSAAEDTIRIPLAVSSRGCAPGFCDKLISLMDINDIMIALIDGIQYECPDRPFIKVGRSAIYNRDFMELYDLSESKYRGEAFEGFIFEDGYKVIVYSNGIRKLYNTSSDEPIDDDEMIGTLYSQISGELSI